MPTKEELKDNIWPIWKILILAKECYQFSYYLHKPETPRESKYLQKSRYFSFIRHILWRNTVIELSKLFNKSPKRDKFNIYHFINKLKSDQYFGGFNISQDKIDFWENELKLNETTITQITQLRDKVYGHSDSRKELENLDTPTFEKTKKLIELVENIIQEIYATVYESHAMMETPISGRMNFNIIKTLAQAEDNKIKDLIEELNRYKK